MPAVLEVADGVPDRTWAVSGAGPFDELAAGVNGHDAMRPLDSSAHAARSSPRNSTSPSAARRVESSDTPKLGRVARPGAAAGDDRVAASPIYSLAAARRLFGFDIPG